MPQLHPLAQAFLTNYEGGKQRMQNQQRMHLAETKELEDQKFREQQAEEVKKRVEEQFKQKDAEMELRAKAFKLEEDKYRNLLTQQAVADIIGGRKKYNNWTDQAMSQVGQMGQDGKYNIVEPDRFVDPVSGVKLDRSQVGTPESVGQAALSMKQPALDYEFGKKKELLGIQGDNQFNIADARARWQAKLTGDKQAFDAQQKALDRQNRTQNTQLKVNAQQQKATASTSDAHPYDTIARGDAPIDDVTTAKNARLSAQTYAKAKGIGYYRKAEADQVANVKGALDQFAKVKDFVVQLMGEAPAEGNNAVMRGRKQGIFGKVWSQGLTNSYNESVKTTAPGIARSLGEKGAFTDKDRAIWDSALPAFDKGDSDNWKGLRTAYDLAYTKAKNTLKDIKPEHREEFLRNKFNLVPVDEFAPPLYETVNGVKYKYDVKQGKYFPAKGGK
jgi:hypothetical protein